MVILTLNCGSSSAKYQVYDWDNKDVLATGVVERVTQDGSVITHKPKGKDKFVLESPCPTHKEAIELILNAITDKEHGVISDMSVIGAVGHRVLHGGDKFTKSVKVTPEVLETFRSVVAQSCEHYGNRGCPESFAECSSCRGFGYGLAPDNARLIFPIRDSKRMVRKIRRATIRLSRNFFLVHGKARFSSSSQSAKRHECHHRACR